VSLQDNELGHDNELGKERMRGLRPVGSFARFHIRCRASTQCSLSSFLFLAEDETETRVTAEDSAVYSGVGGTRIIFLVPAGLSGE
jgi:hypothetical protein